MRVGQASGTGRLISNWDSVTTREMDWTGLKLLLEGIEPQRIRKRYQKKALFIGKNHPINTSFAL